MAEHITENSGSTEAEPPSVRTACAEGEPVQNRTEQPAHKGELVQNKGAAGNRTYSRLLSFDKLCLTISEEKKTNEESRLRPLFRCHSGF